MTRVRVRPQARDDLHAVGRYLSIESNADLALRFLDAADRALARLCQHPLIGARMTVLDPALSGLRSWPVPEFERYLVLYIAFDEFVDVVRILHASRDFTGAMGLAPGLH